MNLEQPYTVVSYKLVPPGERCPTCDRRIPKPRQTTSPETSTLGVRLPLERADALREALDALEAYCGVDPHSYPRGSLLEALVLLGGQQREELRRYFG